MGLHFFAVFMILILHDVVSFKALEKMNLPHYDAMQ